MYKHAYLICAHHQFDILKKILLSLDDEHHDFFIHIDKKSQNVDFNAIRNCVKKSKITFIDRQDVIWGGISQIRCELSLLHAATPFHYHYYHLISGVDLPIKNKDFIYRFFEEHYPLEFVFVTTDFSQRVYERLSLYHIRDRIWYRGKNKFLCKIQKKLLKWINKKSLAIQRLLKIDRIKKAEKIEIGFGDNWFSITDDLAQYVLLQERNGILSKFLFSHCADELFLQIILLNSPFRERRYQLKFPNSKATMREIDWQRGSPYVFRKEDFELLEKSEALFARKFDLNIDNEIIDDIFNLYYHRDEINNDNDLNENCKE